ncbi:MAG: dihydropyrimidinase [Acidimicrobiia bacterium]|nr:dihydropyrimidinase [Acidimicrobiia bacterium]
MEQFDTAVVGGLVVGPDRIEPIDLGIRDGRIAAREASIDPSRSRRIIDASGKYVLPGVLDPHFHPQYGDKLTPGSITAAHGGITTMIPYVYAYRGMTIPEAIEQFLEGDGAGSVLDYGMHFAILDPPNQIDELPTAFERGITSFKFFMAYRRRGMMAEDDMLMEGMERIGRLGGVTMVHAENGLCIDRLEQKFQTEGQTSIDRFEMSRPKPLEYEAVNRAVQIAALADCPLYLVHQTTGESVEIIRRARESGQAVIGETCPQYLVMTNDDLLQQGPIAILTPPYRTQWDNETLWAGLADGTMSTIGSDHSPHPRANKVKDNVFESPVGTPQVETMLPIVYDRGVNEGRITLQRLVAVMCENPARVFGLYPQKGNLQVGADADVVVLDPTRELTIEASELHSSVDYNTYEGWKVAGRPVHTLQRGRDILIDGEVVAEAGQGEYIPVKPGPVDVV